MNRPPLIKQSSPRRRSVRFNDLSLEKVHIIHQSLDELLGVTLATTNDDFLRNLSEKKKRLDDNYRCGKLPEKTPFTKRKLSSLRKLDDLDNSTHTCRMSMRTQSSDLDLSSHQRCR